MAKGHPKDDRRMEERGNKSAADVSGEVACTTPGCVKVNNHSGLCSTPSGQSIPREPK